MTAFAPALGLRSSQRKHSTVMIDGPNMSNLGARNKRVYGAITSLEDLHTLCRDFGSSLGGSVTTFSSNNEVAILKYLHQSAKSTDAYIINPAGLTVGGVATMHALTETGRPYIEVHFANIEASPTAPRGVLVGPWDSIFSAN